VSFLQFYNLHLLNPADLVGLTVLDEPAANQTDPTGNFLLFLVDCSRVTCFYHSSRPAVAHLAEAEASASVILNVSKFVSDFLATVTCSPSLSAAWKTPVNKSDFQLFLL
jgi:hypothetical protein